MRPRSLRPPSAAGLLLCLGTVAAPCVALADPFGYAVGYYDLYRIDLANGQSTRIGVDAAIGFNDVEGLAFDGSGTLYGVADAAMRIGGSNSATTDFLLTINPTTGVGHQVGQLPGLQGHGVGAADNLDYGLAFTCDGRLWLSSAVTTELWQVNPNTAAITLVGTTGATLSGLAARGNTLYGLSIDPTPTLYTVDVDTGSATPVGPLAVGGSVANAGLDFDADGRLWAVLDPGDLSFSRLVEVDPATGAGRVVGNIAQSVGMKGLALAPTGGCVGAPAGRAEVVPGPAPFALTVLGLLAALFGLRRLSRR